MLIPSIAHFVWYGRKLPYLHALAVRSAATHGGFGAVRLHHTDPLDDLPSVRQLRVIPQVEFVPLDDRALCEQAGGVELADLIGKVTSPVARSNLVRTALIYRDGGVYLDMDTLTVRSFDTVRAVAPGFLGEEYIVFPEHVVTSYNPVVKARAYLLTAVRDVLRRIPKGYRYFSRVEQHYCRSVNAAVFGASAGHRFCEAYLHAMTEVPDGMSNKPHALGTHLLQRVHRHYRGNDLHVFEPATFYPLSPEISAHWFRRYASGTNPLEVLSPHTVCVHWYASVRTKHIVARTDEAALRRLSSQQLFSGLARAVLDGEPIEAGAKRVS